MDRCNGGGWGRAPVTSPVPQSPTWDSVTSVSVLLALPSAGGAERKCVSTVMKMVGAPCSNVGTPGGKSLDPADVRGG